MKTTIALLATFLTTTVLFAEDVKPLKVLLITGGCCHDYKKQKDILKTGIEARANVIVDQVHSDDSSVKPPLSIYGNAEYGKGYDVIIHDECSAGISDPATIKAVLQPHADGTPGVNLHCGVHSYRIGNPGEKAEVGSERAMWFDYLGLQSSSHGPQLPIAITVLDAANPVTKSLADWTTGREELYNNIYIHDGAKPLARGKQGAGDKPGQNDTVVAWTNEYGAKKTRVFTTTLGHNNETVADPKYLDFVTNGLLWAAGKLGADGKPAKGYEAKAK